MSTMERIVYVMAAIGYTIALLRAVPILWEHDEIVAGMVILGMLLTIFTMIKIVFKP